MSFLFEVGSDYRAWLLGALLLLAVLVLMRRTRRRRSRGGLDELREAVGVDSISDVLVSDDMGGEIHIEHLLLTARGLVVLDVKTVAGTVFGSDRTDEWTVMTADERIVIRNPRGALHERIAALRLLVRDVPVCGHVLFVNGADFAKGRPSDVILPDELLVRYHKPAKAELDRIVEAFSPHWDRVHAACRPASAPGA